MAIQTADTFQSTNATEFRSRVIYQSESLLAGGGGTAADIQRVQSINYGFTVPRTDVNQYGQLGQIERVITEIPTVTLDFTYNLAGLTNEGRLLGDGGAGSKGFMADINRSASNFDLMKYQIGLSNDGQDYRTGSPNGTTNKGIILENMGITSYSWTGSVGDIPSATVNAEGSKMEIGNVTQGANKEVDTTPRVLRPGNVKINSAPRTGSGGVTLVANRLPVMGFDVVHVQSFTVSVDVPRESIQRLGDRFEYARVITFPIQATMSLEAIVSSQAASNLTDITSESSDDPGQDILIKLGKQGSTGVSGMGLKFKDAKIEGHSISSSIGANKSITMDFACQVDSGEKAHGASSAGFFIVDENQS